MNIVEAMERALKGQKIKRKQKDEWLLVTDVGTELRWFNNRQRAHLTVADIMATDWICEEDVVTVSRCQVEEAFAKLVAGNEIMGKEEFFTHLGFKW